MFTKRIEGEGHYETADCYKQTCYQTQGIGREV